MIAEVTRSLASTTAERKGAGMATENPHAGEVKLEPGLSCPRCVGDQIAARPGNGISRNPGYRCLSCGAKMRGSTAIYLVAIVIGLTLTLISSGLFKVFGDERDAMLKGVVSPFFIPLYLIAVAYAIRQLLRPLPRRINSQH